MWSTKNFRKKKALNIIIIIIKSSGFSSMYLVHWTYNVVQLGDTADSLYVCLSMTR